MKSIIVYNEDCGVIFHNVPENEDRFTTVQKANRVFEVKFMTTKKLTGSTVYAFNQNHVGFQLCKKVQYHFSGDNCAGVQTLYNCNIYTPLDSRQLEFIGNSKIDYITFKF
jgi:hypothetical protein